MNAAEARKRNRESGLPCSPFPKGSVIVIGAGHFGKRAAQLLSSKPQGSLLVVEKDEEALRRILGPFTKGLLYEGVSFLANFLPFLRSANLIVPAVPVHLAYEWLCVLLEGGGRVTRLKTPKKIRSLLPHAWEGNKGSLLVSYADFQCPEDCPEPNDHCTITGEGRETPLHALLSEISLPGYRVHVIRSRQLAPGVGGYTVGELEELLERVKTGGKGKWLVATACRCHGVVSALEVKKGLTRKGTVF